MEELAKQLIALRPLEGKLLVVKVGTNERPADNDDLKDDYFSGNYKDSGTS